MLLAFHGFLGIESGTWFGGARLGSVEWLVEPTIASFYIYQAADLLRNIHHLSEFMGSSVA